MTDFGSAGTLVKVSRVRVPPSLWGGLLNVGELVQVEFDILLSGN